ncbi:hypothetical protein [Candidatus Avelusimicrobium caledoniensis]|uniref:hypothetical protein n=1 Tax=Candidatus Avelusimicrobium caledoniensis TaxID=3416220 RepID=UPI003D0C7A5F
MFTESIFPWVVLDFNTSKDVADWIAAIGPTAMAFIAVCVAVWQLWVSNKQKNLNKQQIQINKQQLEFNKQQIEIQRCNFVYGGFIKEKQDKLLELRNRFLKFRDINMLFLSIIFPCGAIDKKQTPGFTPQDITDISVADLFVSYYIDSQEIPNNLLEKASKINAEFYQFLEDNKIFLDEDPRLYLYLHKMACGFSEFFKEFITKKDLCKEFDMVVNYLIKTANFHSVFTYADTVSSKLWLKKLRQYFYTATRYRFCIDDEGINTNILYRGPDSIFEHNKLQYNEEEWASNDKIAFFTHIVFFGWFQFWRDSIDRSFATAFSDLKRVRNSTKE